MNDLNLTIFAGRLTRDADLHVTKNQKEVASFTLANNRKYKSGGETRETTTFMRCKVWGPLATIVTQYTRKGARVCVTGHLEQEEYQDKDGKTQRPYTLVVADIQLPEKEKGSTGAGQSSDDGAVFDDDTPF